MSQGGHVGAASWSDTVQYLLTSYDQPDVISTDINDLSGICQMNKEVEPAYSRLLNEAVHQFGSVHDRDKVTTVFSKGIIP